MAHFGTTSVGLAYSTAPGTPTLLPYILAAQQTQGSFFLASTSSAEPLYRYKRSQISTLNPFLICLRLRHYFYSLQSFLSLSYDRSSLRFCLTSNDKSCSVAQNQHPVLSFVYVCSSLVSTSRLARSSLPSLQDSRSTSLQDRRSRSCTSSSLCQYLNKIPRASLDLVTSVFRLSRLTRNS